MALQRSPEDTAIQHLKKLIGETEKMYKVRIEHALGLSKRNGSIGSMRNSPCVCGSGKRFKKCCMDRLTRTANQISQEGERQYRESQRTLNMLRAVPSPVESEPEKNGTVFVGF